MSFRVFSYSSILWFVTSVTLSESCNNFVVTKLRHTGHKQGKTTLREEAYKMKGVQDGILKVWEENKEELTATKGMPLFQLFEGVKDKALEEGASIYKKLTKKKGARAAQSGGFKSNS